MAKRTITTEFITEDAGIEASLRPKFLKDYIGQEKVKSNLEIYIEALAKLHLQELLPVRWGLT